MAAFRRFLAVLPVLAALALQACGRRVSSRPAGQPVLITVPLGLPQLPIPADNPPTADSIALGKKLFFDARLSDHSGLSCASCHLPSHSFSDPRRVSVGIRGALGTRHAPTLLNAAYLPSQFWDGRARSLEDQVVGPMTNPVEMATTAPDAVGALKGDPEYPPLFQKVFGTPDITIERIENAIASYERTLLSGDSAFDRYEYGGDKDALTAQQIRGLAVFRDPNRGNCASCHSIDAHYALFTDGKFHNIGEGVDDQGHFDDIGRVHLTGIAGDTGAFMTPTLRNIAERGPYMHDGKVKTLEAVVDFYAGQGNSNPYLDKEMTKIHLTAQDRSDLVAFLKSLTGSTQSSQIYTPEKATR